MGEGRGQAQRPHILPTPHTVPTDRLLGEGRGQAQGPHILPTLPTVPTERNAYSMSQADLVLANTIANAYKVRDIG